MKKLITNQQIIRVSTVLLISLCLSGFAYAEKFQSDNNDTVILKTRSIVQSDQKELEVFLDGFFSKKMEQYHIPGLVFLLIKDGEIFFTKGYGYADVQNQKPVLPDETVFRVGSVSKLFTATAVMQLAELGAIDLHTNVNQYLSHFKLEENHERPVTAADLLTHSAGFRGRSIYSMTRNESERIPLGDFLEHYMPTRSFPPGSVISYSNQGNQLAGYLVEETTGIPFEKYMDENILIPLGMAHSSFAKPANLLPYLAKGYYFSDGDYMEEPIDYSRPLTSPSGSLIATAGDIGHFMIAQLQGGEYQNKRIMNENTCREMQKQQFTNDIRLPGTCYGFYEYEAYGQRAIFHDGDVTGFSSRLFLIPEQNFGFFLCNNNSNSILRMQLTDTLMNHFFSRVENTDTGNFENKSSQNIKRIAGNYRNTRIGLDYFDRFEAASAILPLSEEDISSWIELEPLMYKIHQSNTRLVFRENDKGEIVNLFIDSQQMPVSYERVALYDTSAFLWIPYIFIFLVFLLSVIYWLVKYFRKQKVEQIGQTVFTNRARLLAYAVVVLNLIFILCFTPSVNFLCNELEYGIPLIIQILLFIPIISTLLTIGLPIFAIIAWKRKVWNFVGRLHYSLITITCIGFIIWLYHWNWLGFQY